MRENFESVKDFSGPRETAGRLPRWFSGGLRFECLGCGRCCRGEAGGIFMRPAEEARIALALGLDVAELRRRAETSRWRFPSLRERAGGECVMLGAGARCGIYAVRPIQCRTWPFWPELLQSPEAWRSAARRCPGMDSGPLWSEERILKILHAHEDYMKKLSDEWGREAR